MEFFDLKNISERFMEIVNPTSEEKILKIGAVLGLNENSRIIDFGCGYGETLALWAEHFDISGTGIDIREHACRRAKKKIADRGFDRRIKIVCGSADEYAFDPGTFDVAACMGASFIWDGYRSAIKNMKKAVSDGGKLVIGEAYRIVEAFPPEFSEEEKKFPHEHEIVYVARQEGLDLEYMVRSSRDDWDRYEAENWYGFLRWLAENPDHPDRLQVIDTLRKYQDDYFRFGGKFLGWAMFVLTAI
ncbi:MAG: class I SAM-dependent methyltransferase [Candidatus Adiutricales bacterium]